MKPLHEHAKNSYTKDIIWPWKTFGHSYTIIATRLLLYQKWTETGEWLQNNYSNYTLCDCVYSAVVLTACVYCTNSPSIQEVVLSTTLKEPQVSMTGNHQHMMQLLAIYV